MKQIYLAILCVLSCLNLIQAQKSGADITFDKSTYYYLEDVGYVRLIPHQLDTLKLTKSISIVYLMSSIKGEMFIEKYVYGKLVYKGGYAESPDIFKKLDTAIDPDVLKEVLVIKEYYHPLKDGEWKYYNEDGDLIDTEIWRHGILGDGFIR